MEARCYEREPVAGIRGIVLENEHVLLTVLPDKGADIYQFIDKGTGTDVLSKSIWGFSRMSSKAQSDPKSYWLDHVPGGWQVMFPNAGSAGGLEGRYYPHHGEAGTVAWESDEPVYSGEGVQVTLRAKLSLTPLTIERTLMLGADSRSVKVRETIHNCGEAEIPYAWGQHPSFGYPFLDEGTRIEVNAAWVGTHHADHPVKQLPPSTQWTWPRAMTKSGTEMDLSVLPPRSEKRWELLVLTGLDAGTYSVVNDRLGLRFRMDWPLEEWPYVWLWEELGGTEVYPYYGQGYVFGLEPCSIRPPDGVQWASTQKHMQLPRLKPGETRSVEWQASLLPC